MKGQELKILFKQDKAYLTNDKSMTFEQVVMPDIAKKGFKSPAYWTIRVINYIENERKIFCEVLSYNLGETEFENNQKQFLNELNNVEVVTFRDINTGGLLRTLNGSGSFYSSTEPFVYNTEQIVRQSYKKTITKTFSVPFKSVRFILGGVSFDRKFNEYNKTVELTITNDDIREEYDAVKNYFANVLKTKKIQVTATIELSGHEVTSISAKSPEIDKINKDLIDEVKLELVKATKKKKIDIDKYLFTMDEYFTAFVDENFKSDIFYNNDKDFFDDLLKISNTKHYKHLRFLSSKHLHNKMKLRFIHKPFSFIFLIQGNRNYHIIWETLDTEEATYVWHIANNLNLHEQTLQIFENITNILKVQGKTAYINATEEQFTRIFHDYSELEEGFVKWKNKLENILI